MCRAEDAQAGVGPGGSVKTIIFPGNADGEVEKAIIGEAADRIQEGGRGCLLLDFFNVESLSPDEASKLAVLAKIMRATGGRLTLFNLSEHVYELLVVAGLETALGICRKSPKVSRTCGRMESRFLEPKPLGGSTLPASEMLLRGNDG